MPGIVCAIRGGPHSRPTIQKSIRLAVETGQPLYFLFVVNLDFLSHTMSSRVHTISREMRQMGEFILLTAQAMAESHNLSAEGVVRHGKVADEIIEQCREIQATYVVLGRPQGDQGEDVFPSDQLRKFVERLEKEGDVEVVLVEVGEG